MEQKGLAPILVVLIIALGIGGYLIYSGKINLNQKYSPQQTTQTPTASDQTANWKTYTNSSLGFSFSYPKELSYLYDQFGFNHPDNPEGNLLLQNYDGSKSTKGDSSNFQFQIEAYKNSDQVSLDNYIKNPNKVWNMNNPQTFTSIMLGDRQAYKGQSIQKNEKVPAVWVMNNSYIFTITLSTPNSKNAVWFDKILSTFKFLDKNTSDVSNWKTFQYKSRFSFKYPQNWYWAISDRGHIGQYSNIEDSTKIEDNRSIDFFLRGTKPMQSVGEDRGNEIFIFAVYDLSKFDDLINSVKNADGSPMFQPEININGKRVLKDVSNKTAHVLFTHLQNGQDLILQLRVAEGGSPLLLDQILPTFKFQ